MFLCYFVMLVKKEKKKRKSQSWWRCFYDKLPTVVKLLGWNLCFCAKGKFKTHKTGIRRIKSVGVKIWNLWTNCNFEIVRWRTFFSLCSSNINKIEPTGSTSGTDVIAHLLLIFSTKYCSRLKLKKFSIKSVNKSTVFVNN